LYECEADSLLLALQQAVKSRADLSSADLSSADLRFANLSYANLRFADLSSANLRSANLRFADLRFADLRFANLSYANLSFANLSSADLSSANLSSADLSSANINGKPIIRVLQLSGIGSERRCTTAIVLADSIDISCGCYHGTLPEFQAKIELTHANNPQYLAEYRAAVTWIQSCAAACREAKP